MTLGFYTVNNYYYNRWQPCGFPPRMFYNCYGGFGEYFKWMGISHAIRSLSDGISQIFHPNQTAQCYNSGRQIFPYVNYMC